MKKVEFKKAGILKRIIATTIDIFILLLTFFIAFAFIVGPIFSATTTYDKVNEDYMNLLVDSSLYVKDESTNMLRVVSSSYDEHLTYFYTNYDDINNYYNLKEEQTTLFKYDEENGKYVEIGTSEELNSWYQQVTNDTITNVLAQLPEVKQLSNKINNYNIAIVLVSIIPSAMLVIFLPSILGKYGETLGMRIFSLKAISIEKQPEPQKTQIIIRFCVFLFIELIGSFVAMLIPVIISFLMMLLSKNKTSISDVLSKTIIVDSSINYNSSISDRIEIDYSSNNEVVQNSENIEEK
ncbi:MAG: RDD family protein [Bacilli bacterium]